MEEGKEGERGHPGATRGIAPEWLVDSILQFVR